MKEQSRIKLRAPEPADVDLLYSWENDRELWHMSNTKVPFSRFDLEQYVLSIERDIYATRQARFMIDLISTDETTETIGSIDLFDFDPANLRAGVGILIISEKRKQGYAAEALEQLLGYAFNILNLHQLYCNILENNQASLKLFQGKGFEIIGLKKDWIHTEGKWHNEYLLQLISNNNK